MRRRNGIAKISYVGTPRHGEDCGIPGLSPKHPGKNGLSVHILKFVPHNWQTVKPKFGNRQFWTSPASSTGSILRTCRPAGRRSMRWSGPEWPATRPVTRGGRAFRANSGQRPSASGGGSMWFPAHLRPSNGVRCAHVQSGRSLGVRGPRIPRKKEAASFHHFKLPLFLLSSGMKLFCFFTGAFCIELTPQVAFDTI